MKLSRSTLCLLLALFAASPAITLAETVIRSKNGNFEITLLQTGDTFLGDQITVSWTNDQTAAVQSVIDKWEGMFRNVPARTITATMMWESMQGSVLGLSQSTMDLFGGGNGYNLASAMEMVWREGFAYDDPQNRPDFVLSFNPNFGFSTSNITPADKVDLISVLMHEIGHNAGFNTANNGLGYNNAFTIWDSMIRDSAGRRPGEAGFNDQAGATYSVGSGDLKVYNPRPFEPGSSMAHVTESSDPNSLMQPSIGHGEQIRDFSTKEKALLTEMGWVFFDDPTYYASVDGVTIKENLRSFFTRVLINRNLTVDADQMNDTITLRNLSCSVDTLTLTIAQGKQTTIKLESNEESVCNAVIIGNDAHFEKTGTQNLSLLGNLSTTGNLQIKEGGLALSGTNNSLGSIELSGGVFAIAKMGNADVLATAGRLSATGGMLSLINGASLILQGVDNTIASRVNLSGNGIIQLSKSSVLTFSGSNTIDESIDIDGTNEATLSIASGTLSITGSARVRVNTLSLSAADSTLDLGQTVNTVIGTITGSGSISSSGGQATMESATDSSWSGSLKGRGAINKKGSSKLSLTGVGNSQFALFVQAGTLELDHANSSYLGISVNGGALIVAQKSTITELKGSNGKLTLNSGTLVLNGTNNVIEEKFSIDGNGKINIAGNGKMTIQKDHALSTDITIGGSGTLVQQEGKLTLSNNAKLEDVSLLVGSSARAATNATLDIGATQNSSVSALSGDGTIAAAQGKLTIKANSDSSFSGALTGSGTISKSGNGTWTYSGAGSSLFNMEVNGGTLALVRDTQNSIAMKDFHLASGSSLDISLASAVAAYNTTLSISGSGTFEKGTSVIMHVNPLLAKEEGSIIKTDGTGSLDIQGTTFYVSSYVTDIQHTLSWTILTGNITSNDLKVVASGALAASYGNIQIKDNGNGEIILSGVRKAENPFLKTARSINSEAGAELLWNVSSMEDGTHLGYLNGAVSEMWNNGNYAEANRILAASAGSTIPSQIVAQHGATNREISFIRNRISGMRIEPGLDDSEFPRTSWWVEATSGHDKLDASGDLSGYTLTSWGGRAGVDVNFNERWNMGAAFSAAYGDYSSRSSDTAKGNMDSYFMNLFSHYQRKKWGHSFIVTGGFFNSSIDRTVTHFLDSYRTGSTTNGKSIAAMYELSYDISINESKTALFQPIASASIIHSSIDGYDESGASTTNLRVDGMSMTSGSVAVGGKLSGILDYSLQGRPIMGEVKLMVSQDMGTMGGKAKVAYLNNPGFIQTVRSAEMSRTAVLIGAGVTCPYANNGAFYADAMAELRSDNRMLGGAIGYRYNF